MPIPAPYRPFSQICIAEGVGYEQWQKTAETDKIANLLYDQIDGPNGVTTQTSRAIALITYASIKSIVGNPLFADASAAVRLATIEQTLNNSLVSQGQEPFGLSGRFHRVLTSVINEITYTGVPTHQGDIFSQWVDDLVEGLETGLNILIPPTVSSITLYRINDGEVIQNTAAPIALALTDKLEMATAAVGYTSNDWLKDAGSTATSGDIFTIASATAPDAGVYENAYTNTNGTTISAAFTVTVT